MMRKTLRGVKSGIISREGRGVHEGENSAFIFFEFFVRHFGT
jgi:hypothetical protein